MEEGHWKGVSGREAVVGDFMISDQLIETSVRKLGFHAVVRRQVSE